MNLFIIENGLNDRCYIVRAETEQHALALAGQIGKTWVTVKALTIEGEPDVIWEYEPAPVSGR